MGLFKKKKKPQPKITVSWDDGTPTEVTPNSEPVKEEPLDRLTPEGELPWGWIWRNHEFTDDVSNKNRYFLNAWVSAERGTKEQYAALKSFVIFLHEAKEICAAKGECFEKWFSDIIADDQYIQKRETELAELTIALRG